MTYHHIFIHLGKRSKYAMEFLPDNVEKSCVFNMEYIMPIKGLFRGFDFHIPSLKYSSFHRSLGRPTKLPGTLFSEDKWLRRSTCFCLSPGITFSFAINWCINFFRQLSDRDSSCAVCQGLVT